MICLIGMFSVKILNRMLMCGHISHTSAITWMKKRKKKKSHISFNIFLTNFFFPFLYFFFECSYNFLTNFILINFLVIKQ